jgi:hypothetical protein
MSLQKTYEMRTNKNYQFLSESQDKLTCIEPKYYTA